jgi:phosphoglycolate phosphatase-like HAD superfamily hydrolase
MLRLSDFDAVTFDVYGTLIDWEPSIVAFLQAWAQEQRVTASGDELIMSFDRARAAIQKERPAHLYPRGAAPLLRQDLGRLRSHGRVPPGVRPSRGRRTIGRPTPTRRLD